MFWDMIIGDLILLFAGISIGYKIRAQKEVIDCPCCGYPHCGHGHLNGNKINLTIGPTIEQSESD